MIPQTVLESQKGEMYSLRRIAKQICLMDYHTELEYVRMNL